MTKPQTKFGGGGWLVFVLPLASLGLSSCLVEGNPLFDAGARPDNLNESESESDSDSESESESDGDGGGNRDGESAPCPTDERLVACYRFEAADQLVDDSGYANHGSATALGLSPGRSGLALDCASSEAVQIADSTSLDVDKAITLAMWVRPASFPQSGRAAWFDNSGQYAVMLDADAGFVCRVRTANVSAQVDGGFEWVPLGVWTHIACTYDGAVGRLYADGQQVAELDFTGDVVTNNDEPVAVGSNSPLFDEPCSGQLDDVHVYARALTSVEIEHLAGG